MYMYVVYDYKYALSKYYTKAMYIIVFNFMSLQISMSVLMPH